VRGRSRLLIVRGGDSVEVELAGCDWRGYIRHVIYGQYIRGKRLNVHEMLDVYLSEIIEDCSRRPSITVTTRFRNLSAPVRSCGSLVIAIM
jgi:hypothetical protein